MSDSLHPLIYSDDVVEVYLETHPHYGLFIHWISKKWSKSFYKHHLEVFLELCDQLKDKGFSCIHAAILVDDIKLQKFSEMFGFSYTGESVRDQYKNERGIYKCST